MKGPIDVYLGWKVTVTKVEGVQVNQDKYFAELLLQTGMMECNPISTPVLEG